MAVDDHFYTTIRNTSGTAQYFGFLGRHGKRLAADEEYSVPGDLIAELGSRTSRRAFNSFVAAVAGNEPRIRVIKTPTAFVVDSADPGQTVTLGATANAPAATDYYDSDEEEEAP